MWSTRDAPRYYGPECIPVNSEMVNGDGFLYLSAGKDGIFRNFTRKCPIQKVH